MTELEKKAEQKSLVYNTKYSEDRDLEDVLKNPENYVDSYSYALEIVQMLRQKAFRDGYNAGAKELQEENEQLKSQIEKLKEEKRYETCPYRSTDMGCDYCDYRDRDLKDEG